MTTFQAKIAAGGFLALMGVLLLRCALFTAGAAACMRGGLTDIGLWTVHFATVGYEVWLGMEAARASRRVWVGWVAGLAVFALLNGGLLWMDVPLPLGHIDDGVDNSYRR